MPRHRDPIVVSREVGAPPEMVFEFLADLRNHWRLEDRFVVLGGLENGEHGLTGGRIRIRGPLGLSRQARTRVLTAEPPGPAGAGRMEGVAEVGRRTAGRVEWLIGEDAGGRSHVQLSARAERASVLDRAILALGGRRWMEHRLRAVLATLDAVVAEREPARA